METILLQCECKHDYQDEKYGKNQRVHNLYVGETAKATMKVWRCTVCNTKRVKGVK